MLALVTLVFKLELVRKKSKRQCISEFLLPPANKSLRIRMETPNQVDVRTEVQPEVVGAASRNPMCSVSGFSEWVTSQRARSSGWWEHLFGLLNAGCSWAIPLLNYCRCCFSLSFAKGVYSGVVDGITDETPFLISFIGKAMLQSFPNGPFDALAQILSWRCSCDGAESGGYFLARVSLKWWLGNAQCRSGHCVWSLRTSLREDVNSLDDEIQLMLGEDASPVFSPPPTSSTVCDARVEEEVKRTFKAYYKHKDISRNE